MTVFAVRFIDFHCLVPLSSECDFSSFEILFDYPDIKSSNVVYLPPFDNKWRRLLNGYSWYRTCNLFPGRCFLACNIILKVLIRKNSTSRTSVLRLRTIKSGNSGKLTICNLIFDFNHSLQLAITCRFYIIRSTGWYPSDDEYKTHSAKSKQRFLMSSNSPAYGDVWNKEGISFPPVKLAYKIKHGRQSCKNSEENIKVTYDSLSVISNNILSKQFVYFSTTTLKSSSVKSNFDWNYVTSSNHW